jgi:hypothetical protein
VSAYGIVPIVALVLIAVLFVVMIAVKRRSQRNHGER